MLQNINLHLSVTLDVRHTQQKVGNAFAPLYNKYSLDIHAN
jgi:hypothetical protein